MKRAAFFGTVAGVLAGAVLTMVLFVRDRHGWEQASMNVFAFDLHPGLELNHEMVTTRMVPSRFAYPGLVAAAQALSFAGRIALVKTDTGEPVEDRHFATPERCAAWQQLCADVQRSSPNQLSVLFAARDIEAGRPLTAEDLTEKPVPRDLWTLGEPMFIQARLPGQSPVVVGWVPLAPIKAGDPIFHGYFDVPRINGH